MVYNKNITITKLQHEKGLLIKARKNLLYDLHDLYQEQLTSIEYADDIDMEIQEKINDYVERYNYILDRITTINDTLSILKGL